MVKTATKPSVSKEEQKYRNEQYADAKKILDKNMLCTSCNSSVKPLVLKGKPRSHPFLETLLCEKCYSFFGDGDFSVDEDGSDKYCRWCGQGGTLYLCSKCTAGFCKKCIKRNLPRALREEVEMDDWNCLCCDVKPVYELRALCWAAQQYAAANFKEKNESSSKKRKVKKASDDEGSDDSSSRSGKRLKKDDDSAEEDASKSSRRSGRKPKKNESDDEDSKESSKVNKQTRKSTREKPDRKSKSKSTPEDESTDDENSKESTKPSRKRKAAQEKLSRKSKSKSTPEDDSSDDEKAKARTKQFKLARSKISTVLTDLVKLNDITKNKAVDFKKKKVTPQKVHDLETFTTTAHSVTNLLESAEEMAKKLRLAFSEFTSKFEETVKDMDTEENRTGEENGVEDEENGEVISKEEKDNVDLVDTEKTTESKEEPVDVAMEVDTKTDGGGDADNASEKVDDEDKVQSPPSPKVNKDEEDEEVEDNSSYKLEPEAPSSPSAAVATETTTTTEETRPDDSILT